MFLRVTEEVQDFIAREEESIKLVERTESTLKGVQVEETAQMETNEKRWQQTGLEVFGQKRAVLKCKK